MRVHLREKDGTALRIPIPIGLFLNEFTAPLVLLLSGPYLRKYGVILTAPQLCRLLRALRKARQCLNGIPFMEIRESEGDEITVWL